MREKLEQRLEELKSEFEAGQTALAELETRRANLKETLLRISGAIQVLQEELAKDIQNDSGDGETSEDTVITMPSSRGEKD